MPGGEYIFSSLKSNKSIMLDKTKRFKKTLGGYGYVNKAQFDLPEATPEVLRNIRDRLQQERRQLHLKRGIIFFIITFVLMLIVIY